MRRIVFICLFFWAASGMTGPIQREILAFWDSSEVDHANYAYSLMHQRLEFFVNYLGYKLVECDVNKGIPSDLKESKKLSSYAAIVSWLLDDQMTDPLGYLQVLNTALEQKKKILIFGQLGFLTNKSKNITEPEKVDEFLQRFGLKRTGKQFPSSLFQKVVRKEPSLIEYEAKLDESTFDYEQIQSLNPQNKILLRLENEKNKESYSDVAVITPYGGVIQSNFIFSTKGPYIYWRLNPFKYLSLTLEQNSSPVPDVTSLYGNRIFFTHIDGDGFSNLSDVDKNPLSAQVLFDQILSKYPYPTTVSVITAEMDPRYFGSTDKILLAKKILSLPHVEPSSHTFSHPLVWLLNPTKDDLEDYQIEVSNTGYTSGSITSFKIPHYKMNYESEITGSINFINQHLLPKEKKVHLLQWSGNAVPTEDVLRLVEKNNVLNINGGGSYQDRRHPSFAYMRSYGRQLKNLIQVYAANKNEAEYTNGWTGPLDGFTHLQETWVNTESPQRLLPMNLYYHFYSADKVAGLKALKSLFDWIGKQKVSPIFTSEYAQIVQGFYQAKVEKLSNAHFKISNNQMLRTFRLDGMQAVFPDLEKSSNVVGYEHFQGSLYLFLGNAPQTHIILTNKKPQQPFVAKSNVWINTFRSSSLKIEMEILANVNPEIILAGITPGKTIQTNSQRWIADKKGEIKITLSTLGKTKLLLESR